MWGREHEQFLQDSLFWITDMRKALEGLSLEEWHRASFLERLLNIEQNINQLYTTKDEHMIFEVQSWITRLQEDVQLYFRQQERGEYEATVGKHVLPKLPYAYDSMEPYISTRIMYLHHTKHHQKYVDNLNKAEQKLSEARQLNDFSLITHWERELAFNGSGHYLHSLFWKNLCPHGGGLPKGELKKQIEQDFSSVEKFMEQFTQAANKVEGVGWAIVVYSIQAKKLEILQSEKHQNLTQWNTIPIMVLDVWEHAYYLQYENRKEEYVQNWWNIVKWSAVEKRLEKAKACYNHE